MFRMVAASGCIDGEGTKPNVGVSVVSAFDRWLRFTLVLVWLISVVA